MREIKFRIWSKRKKEFIYTDLFNWEKAAEGKLLARNDYIIQQYTKLKDDDGKGIYEGDIVEYVYHIAHGPHEEGRGVVYWDDEIGGFLFDETSQFNRIELTKCKVVGNIHEGDFTDNDE